MVTWRIFIIMIGIISSLFLVPLHAQASHPPSEIVFDDVPQLESAELSCEEQSMIDAFQVAAPSPFWQWVRRVGSAMTMHYIVMKKRLENRATVIQQWWRKPMQLIKKHHKELKRK